MGVDNLIEEWIGGFKGDARLNQTTDRGDLEGFSLDPKKKKAKKKTRKRVAAPVVEDVVVEDTSPAPSTKDRRTLPLKERLDWYAECKEITAVWVTLPCGHTNHSHEDDPKQIAAREAGYCCHAMQQATENQRRLNPGAKRVTLSVNWQVRGLTHPVPMPLRRSPEKEATGGFPGLCCDPETGLYIGGVGNDCRRTGSDSRCVCHG